MRRVGGVRRGSGRNFRWGQVSLFLFLAVTHGEGFAHQLLNCVWVYCVAVGMATKLTNITSLECLVCACVCVCVCVCVQ